MMSGEEVAGTFPQGKRLARDAHESCSVSRQILRILQSTDLRLTMRSPLFDLRNPARYRRAFTLMEVMVSTLLISIAMGNILMMNLRAVRILKASREVAAASQMLQQRVEIVRDRPWS